MSVGGSHEKYVAEPEQEVCGLSDFLVAFDLCYVVPALLQI